MNDYNDYIRQLKSYRAELNDKKAYSQIQARINKRVRNNRWAMGGTLATLVICGLALFTLQPFRLKDGDLVSAYVFQSENGNGNPVLSYVLAE